MSRNLNKVAQVSPATNRHSGETDERTDWYRITFYRVADVVAGFPTGEVEALEMVLRELPSTGGVAGEGDPAD